MLVSAVTRIDLLLGRIAAIPEQLALSLEIRRVHRNAPTVWLPTMSDTDLEPELIAA